MTRLLPVVIIITQEADETGIPTARPLNPHKDSRKQATFFFKLSLYTE